MPENWLGDDPKVDSAFPRSPLTFQAAQLTRQELGTSWGTQNSKNHFGVEEGSGSKAENLNKSAANWVKTDLNFKVH